MLRRGLLKEYASVLSFIARSLDVFSVGLVGLLAYGWRFGHIDLPSHYWIAILLAMLISLPLFHLFNLYQSWRGQSGDTQIRLITGAVFFLFTILIIAAFLTKTSVLFSRQWTAEWGIFTWVLLIINRIALGKILRFMRKKGFNRKRIVILGAGNLGQNVLTRIRETIWMGLDVVAFLDDDTKLHGTKVEGIEVQGALSDISSVVKNMAVDEVWIALPLWAEKQVKVVLENLRHSTVTVRYVPDIFGFRLLNHSMINVAGLAVINLSATPMDGVNRIIKKVEDILLSLVLLLVFSPLFLIIAIFVKLSSPGPVFYRQERVSWNGDKFVMLKFRSMPVDLEKDSVEWGGAGTNKKPTAIGKFLRRTSLDELPQFVNVLKGEMSIVGPRPERPMFVDRFKDEIPDYMKKHLVKAGITGWAQINGLRGDTDIAKRIEYDLYYIENMSLWLDLKIIFLTVFSIFSQKNAN